jgi:hypothetical protein
VAVGVDDVGQEEKKKEEALQPGRQFGAVATGLPDGASLKREAGDRSGGK